MAGFEYRNAEDVRDAFKRHKESLPRLLSFRTWLKKEGKL